MNIQVCRNTSDAEALYLPQRLFLKPLAKINIVVQLPSTKVIGKAISNWELMERLRSFVQPEIFSALKVSKSNSDIIRFEAEIEDRRKLDKVLGRLDDRTIKLDNYPDSFKIRASEAKLDFPHRHAWDSFFRDAQNMDEMKSGERPDTIYLSYLPIKWFIHEKHQNEEDAKPSEHIFRKIFEKFGKVRVVDIPICDPYRKEMKPHMAGIRMAPHEQELYFEGYVQFIEYVAFVRAMDAFRGMKLLHKQLDNTAEVVEITVDFDKTKHMSDATIKRRAIVRERLIARKRVKEEKEKEEQEEINKREEHERRRRERTEQEKLANMVDREEKRKIKRLAKLRAKEADEINRKIAQEQKKLLKTQRKLQSIRLIEELFKRIQLKHKFNKVNLYDSHLHSSKLHDRFEVKKLQSALLKDSEQLSSRERLMSKYINAQERELEHQREKINNALNGKLILRSALEMKKPKARASSISSISSEESFYETSIRKIKTERPSADDGMTTGQVFPPIMHNYNNYGFPYPNPAYPYQQPPPGGYYPGAPMYPPTVKPMGGFVPRGRGFQRRQRGGIFSRGSFRGGTKMPYFNGPNANHEYYMYFKRLAEGGSGERDDRSRSRSRSRRRSYSNSKSRSRSRSRNRRRHSRSRSRSRSRYTRSRSRSRSRGSRSRRSRSASRKTRSRSRSYSRSRRSRTRSRSRSRAEKTRSSKERSAENERRSKRSCSGERTGERRRSPSSERPTQSGNRESSPKIVSMQPARLRSKSWSLPKECEKDSRSWSKSPVDANKKLN